MTLSEYEKAKAEIHRDFQMRHVAFVKDGIPYAKSCIESDICKWEAQGYEVLEKDCATLWHAKERARQLVPLSAADAIRARRDAVLEKHRRTGEPITRRSDINAIYGKTRSGVTREDYDL